MTDLPGPELEPTNCPLCDSGNSQAVIETVDRLCGLPGTFYVHRCRDCDHLFLNPRPTAATLHLCYPEEYGPHQTPVTPPTPEETSGDAPPATVPWYLKYLPLRYIPGLRQFYYWLTDDLGQPLPQFETPTDNNAPVALELGCSTGAYLSELREAGWDTVGIEPSETASEKARAAGLKVHTGILDDVELKDASFNAVAAWMVVEHTIEPVKTLEEFYRILQPGGQLLFSVPNVGCWEPRVFGVNWYLWEAPRHLNHFTPRRLRQILSELGYSQIQVLHQRNVLNVLGSLGITLKRWGITRRLGERILRYPDNPRMAIQLLLSPLAMALSFLRQGGRLTVLARRPESSQQNQRSLEEGLAS